MKTSTIEFARFKYERVKFFSKSICQNHQNKNINSYSIPWSSAVLHFSGKGEVWLFNRVLTRAVTSISNTRVSANHTCRSEYSYTWPWFVIFNPYVWQELTAQHYGIKHRTRRFISMNFYRQSVCAIFRSNLDTTSLIGVCIENETLWHTLAKWTMS